ncbi:phosphatidylinositol 4-phosphate 3-kinase C2 domain-containing subunit gamma-like, partial [Alligator sinensis]|uniref:Phosphatidylinositol 4-phosphate 3-kinase C2 domain-containing subunit gamma-like n=1 Tax=Alligator sinensis TaxID=38654 RepID=A0A3Q0FQR4_ALLSI
MVHQIHMFLKKLSFFTSNLFDLNATEQHLYGVNQPRVHGEFYFGSPVSPWQQTTGPPAVGFRPSLLPGCYNFSVEDSYPTYPLETYYNYDAYRRNSSSQIEGEFGSVVEENENKLNFHIGFEHSDAQYLMFSGDVLHREISGDSPNGQGMNNRSGDARTPFPISYGETYLTDSSTRFTLDPLWPSTSENSMNNKELAGWSIQLAEVDQGSNESTASFCSAVKKIRDSCPAFDSKKNTGKIWSVATMVPNQILCKSKLRISILTNSSSQPLHLTPYASCIVHDLIAEILRCTDQYPEQKEYFLIVCGSDEVLQNDQTLGSHDSLRKAATSIQLHLQKGTSFQHSLARTHQQHKVDSVIEEIKAICSAFSSVETRDITDAVEKLHSVPLGKAQISLQNLETPVK